MKKALRRVYDILPFKYYIYNGMRKIIRLPKKWHAYFYFKGDFTTKLENTSFKMRNYGYQFHVENELFWGGIENGWEKVSLMLWVKLCKMHNHIVDIGANTGLFSVVAKAINPQASVLAFEPMPRIYDKLVCNVQLNNLDIETSTYALSDYDGEATVYPTNLDHVYSVTVNKKRDDITEPVHEVKIQTIRFDHYIEQQQIPAIDLIKIDVESHEPEVLEGMGKYLKQFQPTFLIEIQSDEIADRIAALISGCDYVFYNIDENKGIAKVDRLAKSSYFNYLICSPQTAKMLELE